MADKYSRIQCNEYSRDQMCVSFIDIDVLYDYYYTIINHDIKQDKVS